MDFSFPLVDSVGTALAARSTQYSALARSALSRGAERVQAQDYETALNEFKRAAAYDPTLARRPQLVALGKLDLTETRDALPRLVADFAARGITLRPISAVTGEGIAALMEAAYRLVQSAAQREADRSERREAPSMDAAQIVPSAADLPSVS